MHNHAAGSEYYCSVAILDRAAGAGLRKDPNMSQEQNAYQGEGSLLLEQEEGFFLGRKHRDVDDSWRRRGHCDGRA